MSSVYFISEMQEEGYQHDIAKFTKSLEEHWTDIEFFDASSSYSYVLNWSFDQYDYHFLGGLQADRHTVTLQCSDPQILADFAIWYRTLVSEKYKLFIWKAENWETPVELTYNTNTEDILRGFNQI